MKTMKKLQIFLVVAMLVVLATMAIGCEKEDKVEEYKFSDIEVTSNLEGLGQSLEEEYKNFYKGYSLSVTDKQFILKTGSTTTKMTYKKDGDKYILPQQQAEEAKNLLNATFAGTGITYTDMVYYGEQTDKGWAMVLEMTLSAQGRVVNAEIDMLFEDKK